MLLFLCCHPALTPPAQVALTLRAVGGLSTAEIARSLLLPEATITRRITRAKQSILAAGGRFALPDPADRTARLDVVLHVIYLIFTEGHTATAGDDLVRGDLCAEAIRLGRLVRRLLPDEPEVGGLLAQMLLTDARRAAPDRPGRAARPAAPSRTGAAGTGRRSPKGIALVTDVPGPAPTRAVPAAGGDQCGARRGRVLRRDGLAADPGPVRRARPAGRRPDGHPEPRGRPRPGPGTCRRPGPAGDGRDRPAARRPPPRARRPRATCWRPRVARTRRPSSTGPQPGEPSARPNASTCCVRPPSPTQPTRTGGSWSSRPTG